MLTRNIFRHNFLVRHFSHVPVMAQEIVDLMSVDDGKVFIDMTFGAGGHTRALLNTNRSIKVIAVDRDPLAYRKAQQLAAETAIKSEKLKIKQTVIPVQGKFSEVMNKIHLSGIPYDSVNGVIFDLGASSMQYDDSRRGFSLSTDGPLDMRMDPSNSSNITAEDVVNNLNEDELALIFKILGGEKKSRKVASAIADARVLLGRIKTTQELSRIIATSRHSTIDSLGRFAHPGTKVFQALRIFVNNELNELNYAIDKVRQFLIPTEWEKVDGQDLIKEPFGLAAVLTFHSLEDTIVKRHFTGIDLDEPTFKYLNQRDRIRTSIIKSSEEVEKITAHKFWKPILKHVQKPSDEEIAANPRSRSAKLRAAVRIA